MDKSTPIPPAPDTYIEIDNSIIDEYGEKIGAYGLAVYTIIKRLTQKPGRGTPSYAAIARTIGIDRRTVSRYVKKLTALHLISTSLRIKEDGSQSSNHSHVSAGPRSSGYMLMSYGESLRDETG